MSETYYEDDDYRVEYWERCVTIFKRNAKRIEMQAWKTHTGNWKFYFARDDEDILCTFSSHFTAKQVADEIIKALA